jgi:hypothetical protein
MKRLALCLALALCLSEASAARFLLRGSRPGPRSVTVAWGVLPTTKADGSALTIGNQLVFYDLVTRQGTTCAAPNGYGNCYAFVANANSASALSLVVAGLAALTNYCFAVAAVDGSGIVSNPSNEVCVTTS